MTRRRYSRVVVLTATYVSGVLFSFCISPFFVKTNTIRHVVVVVVVPLDVAEKPTYGSAGVCAHAYYYRFRDRRRPFFSPARFVFAEPFFARAPVHRARPRDIGRADARARHSHMS